MYDLFSFQVLKLEVHCHYWTGRKRNENTKLYYEIIIIVIFIQRIPTRTDEHSDSHFVIFYVNACAVCR